MCVISMVMDHYNDKWANVPLFKSTTFSPQPPPLLPLIIGPPAPTREEFDRLRREVEDLRGLLARAKEYDRKNGEPDCEASEKVKLIRRVAEAVGVDLGDLLKSHP